MSADPKPLQEPDPLDAAADQVIAACDGDVRAAVLALIVAKGLLEAELNDVYAATSQRVRSRRIKRSEQDQEEVMAERRTSLCDGRR
jgi:hypothetical protein